MTYISHRCDKIMAIFSYFLDKVFIYLLNIEEIQININSNTCILSGMNMLSEEATPSTLFWPPEKGSTLRSKFLPIKLESFSEEVWYAGKQAGSCKVFFDVKIAENLPTVSTVCGIHVIK